MKNTEENIKKFHKTINSKCPICNQLLNVDADIFKSNDVGFHSNCVKNTSKEDIENLVDDVLDNVYGVKAETIMEGERDTVLNRYDYGDCIIYMVEFWNDDKTDFCFGTEYDTFEEAFRKFKSMQYETKEDKKREEFLNEFKVQFDVIMENCNNAFLLRQTYRDKYNFYVTGYFDENKRIKSETETEFENDFESAYKHFKTL